MSMIKEEIKEKFYEIIAYQFGVEIEDIRPEDIFENKYASDSLDFIELLMACEDLFEISIPDEEAENIKTVQQALDYLENKLNS